MKPVMEIDGSGETKMMKKENYLQMRRERRKTRNCWRECRAGKTE